MLKSQMLRTQQLMFWDQMCSDQEKTGTPGRCGSKNNPKTNETLTWGRKGEEKAKWVNCSLGLALSSLPSAQRGVQKDSGHEAKLCDNEECRKSTIQGLSQALSSGYIRLDLLSSGCSQLPLKLLVQSKAAGREESPAAKPPSVGRWLFCSFMVGCHFSGLSVQCLSLWKRTELLFLLKRREETLFLTESQWRHRAIKHWENSLNPLIVIMPKATRAAPRDDTGRVPLVRCRARPSNSCRCWRKDQEMMGGGISYSSFWKLLLFPALLLPLAVDWMIVSIFCHFERRRSWSTKQFSTCFPVCLLPTNSCFFS